MNHITFCFHPTSKQNIGSQVTPTMESYTANVSAHGICHTDTSYLTVYQLPFLQVTCSQSLQTRQQSDGTKRHIRTRKHFIPSNNEFTRRKADWYLLNQTTIIYTFKISYDIKNSVAFSPQANYTNSATTTCWWPVVQTFADRGVLCGQRRGSPMVVNLSFLDRRRYFSFK
jgi:hypothetical protein